MLYTLQITRRSRALVLTALLCAASGLARARAQDAVSRSAADYGARAEVSRPLASVNREDPTAAGTEIDTGARSAAYETVDEVLLEAPGAHPLRSGWLGSFTTASLRGADVEQTAVLFGEIPISSADAAAFDFSTIPVELLDRITVFRGGSPLWLGQNAIGGVVQLQPRRAEGNLLSGTVNAGSFSTYGVSLASAVVPKSGGFTLLTSAGTLGTRGDFAYADDHRTPLDPSDDSEVRRANADMVQGHGLVQASTELGPGRLTLLGLGFERTGGEPGAPSDPAHQTRRSYAHGLGGASYTIEQTNAHGERVLRLQVLGSVGLSRAHFSDLYGEIGPTLPKLTSDGTVDAFGRIAVSAAATPFLELTLLGSARRELYAHDDPFGRIPLPDSTRSTLSAGAEANLHGRIAGHLLELRPSLQVQHAGAALRSEHFAGLVQTNSQNTLPTYRTALGVELLPDVTLSASTASGVRTPSLGELFGDGVLILGNTSLEAEKSRSYDIGLVDVTCLGDFSGSFEARVFDLSIANQVVFIRNSFAQLFPINLQHSDVRGLELGAHTNYGQHISLAGAATLLDTEGKPGKRLPNRPGTTFFVEPGASTSALGPFDALRFFVSANYASQSYDDPDNAALPKHSQIFFDAGTTFAFAHEHAELRITASDLFDRGGSDLRHFPLPGRTVMASFSYREDTK